MKQMGARNAGNPHVACDVEGAGDVERSRYLGRPARQSSTLPMSGVWKRSQGRTSEAPPDERGGNRYVRPTATAPHLDSTVDCCGYEEVRRTSLVGTKRNCLGAPAVPRASDGFATVKLSNGHHSQDRSTRREPRLGNPETLAVTRCRWRWRRGRFEMI